MMRSVGPGKRIEPEKVSFMMDELRTKQMSESPTRAGGWPTKGSLSPMEAGYKRVSGVEVSTTQNNNMRLLHSLNPSGPTQQTQTNSYAGIKLQEIQVSEFLAENQTAEVLTSDRESENINNEALLANIHRIVSCKRQAQELLSQIEGYAYIIKKLKRQNQEYQLQIEITQKENKKLRDTLHLQQMQVLTLQEDRDRCRRMQLIEAAKVKALQDITHDQEKDKWDSMLQNKIDEITQKHQTQGIQLLIKLKRNEVDCKWSQAVKVQNNCESTGLKKRVGCWNCGEDNPEGERRKTNMTNLRNIENWQQNQFGRIVRLGSSTTAKQTRNKWEEESTIA